MTISFGAGDKNGRWRTPLRVLALLALLTAQALLAVAESSAHAELERSEPPAEGLLVAPPRAIELWFTERIDTDAGSPSVRVLDDQGQELAVTQVTVDPANPRHVTARVADVAPGVATVVWSARSLDDGHTLTGTFAFRVGAGRAPGAATVAGERPPIWAVATRWATFLGLALAAAGFAFSGVMVNPGTEPPAIAARRYALVVVGFALALVATAAEPLLQQRWPPAGSVSPSLDDVIAGLPTAWWLRPVAALPGLVVALTAWRLSGRNRPLSNVLLWGGCALALAGLLGLSLTSHAAARGSWRALAVAANIVHQWSIALWVGGLVHLWRWWTRHRAAADEPGETPAPVRRFSRFALVLVLVGIATGVINGGFVLPAARALWETDYGTVLILKVALLTVPLALATFNRRALRRLATASRSTLRRAVRAEAAVVLGVVLGGSILALMAPPLIEADQPVAADVPMPALAAYDGQNLLVHLIFAPGKPGQNTLRVELTDFDNTPFTGERPALVRLAFAPLAFDTAPESVDAAPEPGGAWVVRGSQLSLPGWWSVTVTVRWLGRADAVVPFYLLLPDPNLHGLDAPDADPPSDPAAAAAYETAMAAHTATHRVRYSQAMASHVGTVSYGVHVVNDGADGSEPGFTFDIPGGWQYIVLGTASWSKRPGETWEQSETNPMIPPSDWDEEYTGARGFQLGRQEVIDGELCQTITFVVPGTDTRVVAWYVWWVGLESGRLRREMMISQSHYMLSNFSAFDEPAPIIPPDVSATPVARD